MKFFSARGMKRQHSITLDLVPITSEQLSAKGFLALAKRDPGLIKSSHVVMPKPGKTGFGTFMVEYSRPIFKAEN